MRFPPRRPLRVGDLIFTSLFNVSAYTKIWLLWHGTMSDEGTLSVASLFFDGPQDRNQVPLISFLYIAKST